MTSLSAIPTVESPNFHPITMVKIDRQSLNPKDRKSLIDRCLALEAICFGGNQTNDGSVHFGHTPTTDTLAEQRFSPADITTLINAPEGDVYFYAYLGGPSYMDPTLVGYFACLTDQGEQNPTLQNLCSDNHHALPNLGLAGDDHSHIINFLMDPAYRHQVKGHHFANWFHHLVIPDLIPNGGYTISNSDINLRNLRLAQIMVWPDIINRWKFLNRISPQIETLAVGAQIFTLNLLSNLSDSTELSKRLITLKLHHFYLSAID